MFTRLLIGLDGSPRADAALEHQVHNRLEQPTGAVNESRTEDHDAQTAIPVQGGQFCQRQCGHCLLSSSLW